MEKDVMTVEEFEAVKAEMIRLAEEMWKENGYPFWFNFPVSLRDAKYDVFRTYYDFVLSLYHDVLIKKAEPDTAYELLPAWYMDPTEPCGSIGWRMGGGESYMMCLWAYLDSLSEEAQNAWHEKYPVPPHFDEKKWEEYYYAHPEVFTDSD